MEIQEKIDIYLKAKTKEILALAEQGLIDHIVLIGKHREGVLCQFLRDIFPKRYSIDNGMVYGIIGRSKEADIMILFQNAKKFTESKYNLESEFEQERVF